MDEPQVRSKMQHSLDSLVADLKTLRTGRATPSLIESLVVPVYGGTTKMKIVELAGISAPDTQTLVVSPWDKSIIGEIRQGILAANTGMNPVIDGDILRISLPPLTGEDREKYVKLVSTKLEAARIAVRQIRADLMHEIKKAFESKEISEDVRFGDEKKLQEITDDFIGKIDQAGEAKKNELREV